VFDLPICFQKYQERKEAMKATRLLNNLGQSIWLDNITRDLLNTGTLKQYISDLSVTGLTSNPTNFDHAADLFRPIYDSTNTVDGWTSLEVSPLLDAPTPVRGYPQRSWIAS
jgi:transaldolase